MPGSRARSPWRWPSPGSVERRLLRTQSPEPDAQGQAGAALCSGRRPAEVAEVPGLGVIADLGMTSGRIAQDEAVPPGVGREPLAAARGAEVVGDPRIGPADRAEVDCRPELVLRMPRPS